MTEHSAETLKKINNILGFITDKFYEFERMQMFNENKKELLFKNEQTFVKHNEKCLHKMSKDDIDFLYILCNKIEKGKILTTDMEYFSEWKANVIYFNKLGQLVIAHPR